MQKSISLVVFCWEQTHTSLIKKLILQSIIHFLNLSLYDFKIVTRRIKKFSLLIIQILYLWCCLCCWIQGWHMLILLLCINEFSSYFFRALYGSFFGLMIIFILLTTLGLVIFTTYAECDLLRSKSLNTPDQVIKMVQFL